MKKLRGQGVIIKNLTSKIAAFNKKRFMQYIDNQNKFEELVSKTYGKRIIDIEVVSFSSARDFSEQILSILSFTKNVGFPSFWTIYSDGTHTEEQIKKIELTFAFIKIIKINSIDTYICEHIKDSLYQYKELLISYAKEIPLGKRLFLYLNYPINKSTLFLDSDILFYEKSICLNSLINDNKSGWFLPDADWNNLDSRYMVNTSPQPYQVNGGFFLLNKELNKVSIGLDFLKNLNGIYEYFSDQTVFHIIFLENSLMPLDPRIFALNSDDQFNFGYSYPKEKIAIRHYTGPVRHKMWQQDWKWHLSLS